MTEFNAPISPQKRRKNASKERAIAHKVYARYRNGVGVNTLAQRYGVSSRLIYRALDFVDPGRMRAQLPSEATLAALTDYVLSGDSVNQVAKQYGRSARSLYYAFSRISPTYVHARNHGAAASVRALYKKQRKQNPIAAAALRNWTKQNLKELIAGEPKTAAYGAHRGRTLPYNDDIHAHSYY
ncbi:MAG: hypothetical protein U5M23_00255 [Marinagarivorans sp.]|nr:hypothetical protein [Marinagarivorans sp.]